MFTKYTTEISTSEDGKNLVVRTSVHGFAVYGYVMPSKDTEGEVIGDVYDVFLDDHLTGKKAEIARVVDFQDAMQKVHEAMLAFVKNPGGAPEIADALEKALL